MPSRITAVAMPPPSGDSSRTDGAARRAPLGPAVRRGTAPAVAPALPGLYAISQRTVTGAATPYPHLHLITTGHLSGKWCLSNTPSAGASLCDASDDLGRRQRRDGHPADAAARHGAAAGRRTRAARPDAGQGRGRRTRSPPAAVAPLARRLSRSSDSPAPIKGPTTARCGTMPPAAEKRLEDLGPQAVTDSATPDWHRFVHVS